MKATTAASGGQEVKWRRTRRRTTTTMVNVVKVTKIQEEDENVNFLKTINLRNMRVVQ